MKIGDKIKCISLCADFYQSDYLILGQYYEIKNINYEYKGSNTHYVVIYINNHGLIAYHPDHFQSISQARKEKLKKLNKED